MSAVGTPARADGLERNNGSEHNRCARFEHRDEGGVLISAVVVDQANAGGGTRSTSLSQRSQL